MKKLLLLFLFVPLLTVSSYSLTLSFICGFECGVSATTTHGLLGADGTFNTSIKKSGDRSIRLNPTASTGGTWSSMTIASTKVWTIRVYVYFASLPTATTYIAGASTTNGCWFKSSDSKLYASVDGTTFSSVGITVTTGQWYRLDIRYNDNISACDIQVDGTSTTSVSTIGNTPSSAQLGSSASRTFDIYFDDLAISNTASDFPIGGGYINHFVGVSDNSHNISGGGDFAHGTAGADITNATTDAYTLIDDVPVPTSITTTDLVAIVAPPNAGDYVQVLIGPAPGISTPTTAPRYVSVIIAYHQAGTGSGNMEVRLNDNGTTGVIYTATGVAGVTSLAYSRAAWLDPPSAATSWTLSGNGNFNNIKVQIGSPASVDANPDQYVDGLVFEAEFQEVNNTVPGTPSDKRLSSTGVGMIAMNKLFNNIKLVK